ncbi:hypothetical protein ACFYM0_37005 [Streptomyces sp. NPDC006487]|uniref:hypothetical protein n=1 Tax=Streptomyces sp. NPDC006487 TaxID=3364748 RepID=UPI0036B31097
MTDHARAAIEHLCDASRFQWYAVPLLLLVLYVYAAEVQRRNRNVFFAGLALWGMDWFNEVWNALVFHCTERAPVWGASGPSAYRIPVGLNIEICPMFAVMGVAAAKLLPPKGLRILGGSSGRPTDPCSSWRTRLAVAGGAASAGCWPARRCCSAPTASA